MVVPEISQFNFELNSPPMKYENKVFSQLEQQVRDLWKKCDDFANEMDLRAIMIGTLPTLRDHMLKMDYLSAA